MRTVIPIAICLACAFNVAEPGRAAETTLDPTLRAFLKAQFAKYDSAGAETRAAVARASLTKEGLPVVVVYLMGDEWCGSGGCTLALIQPKDGSFQIISKTPIVQLPIKVLPSRTHGWNDLAVGVGGGGVRPGFAKLSFNGRRYAGNPSRSPRVPGSLGTALISEHDQGEPLSP